MSIFGASIVLEKMDIVGGADIIGTLNAHPTVRHPLGPTSMRAVSRRRFHGSFGYTVTS